MLFLGVDTERDFQPLVSSFIKHTKLTNNIPLSRYRTGTIHTQRTWRLLL
jgi:hypothetical protein